MKKNESVLHDERWELLEHINNLTDKPLTALAFVWLWLLILDLTSGLDTWLAILSSVIWGLFALDFLIEIVIAPDKREYLRYNWLTALSLVLPAFRILRIFRALRMLRAAYALRAFSLARLVVSINRGLRALAQTFRKRGFGYIVALTLIVVFAGAAGMQYFESPDALRESGHERQADQGLGIKSYGESVWWTGMLLTTLGSDYWPQTIEGRLLCWLLALYAVAVFGYITATIASYFVDVDKEKPDSIDSSLRDEIAALRAQIAILIETNQSPPRS
jgi:voltage-gated potassium channel